MELSRTMIKWLEIVVASIPSSVESLHGHGLAVRMPLEREKGATAHTSGKVAGDSERQLQTKSLLSDRALAAEHRGTNFSASNVEAVAGADVSATEVVGVRELVTKHTSDVVVSERIKSVFAQRHALHGLKVARHLTRRTLHKGTRHGASAVVQRLHQPSSVKIAFQCLVHDPVATSVLPLSHLFGCSIHCCW